MALLRVSVFGGKLKGLWMFYKLATPYFIRLPEDLMAADVLNIFKLKLNQS